MDLKKETYHGEELFDRWEAMTVFSCHFPLVLNVYS